MAFYTRPQLVVLLLVAITAATGLGVGYWRRAHPELADRLERFDRVDPADVATVLPREPSLPRSEAAPRRAAPPKSAPLPAPVDVNRASQEELRTLPGIGAVLAGRILEARERDGPFGTLDDLRRVRGLGRAKLDRIASVITLTR